MAKLFKYCKSGTDSYTGTQNYSSLQAALNKTLRLKEATGNLFM
jgi:hypothetical protein